jgi:hypothetical protein
MTQSAYNPVIPVLPHEPTTPPIQDMRRVDPDVRKSRLAQGVQNEVIRGGVVETQSDYNAVIRYGKPINHTLHLILTLVTFTFWALVWIGVALVAMSQKKTITLTVDEYGQLLRQQV